MEANGYNILAGVLILLSCAVVITTLFRRLHLPSILGYLVVGVIVGPYALGLFDNTEATRYLAEFGVVFLMFTIGLEFSLAKLLSMKKQVFVLGGLQVTLTTAITMGIAMLAGIPLETAVAMGGIVAMSSTAIVIKQLNDQIEINTLHGNNTVGILLFQDLAVIAFLILIPGLDNQEESVLVTLGIALVNAAVMVGFILLMGRWILRPLFHEIAKAKSLELFTLFVLLVALGAAWLTEHIGLSLALGAFLAGMMLGETEYRHQIEIEIRPFRDVLLGLFFITIGMLVDFHSFLHIWPQVLGVLCLMMIFKLALISGLARFLGSDPYTALRTGLLLAQGGEFGFAELTLALKENLLTNTQSQILLDSIVISMAIAPFIIRYNRPIARFLLPKSATQRNQDVQAGVEETAKGLDKHVVICGYGRVGQHVARFLEIEAFEFIALDMDPERVQDAQLAGERVTYGDSKNLHILEAAGLDRARALVISFHDIPSTFKILEQTRKHYPDLPILVRTQDDTELEALQAAGATEVVPETLEASLMLAFHTLVLMNVPARRALHQLRDIRKNRYELLHRVFPSHDDIEDLETNEQREQLYVVSLPEQAYAINKSLGELPFEHNQVAVTAICRNGIRRPDPGQETIIEAQDVLVLCGLPQQLEHIEHILLQGS